MCCLELNIIPYYTQNISKFLYYGEKALKKVENRKIKVRKLPARLHFLKEELGVDKQGMEHHNMNGALPKSKI